MGVHIYTKLFHPLCNATRSVCVLQQSGMIVGSVCHGYTYIHNYFTISAMHLEAVCVATERYASR